MKLLRCLVFLLLVKNQISGNSVPHSTIIESDAAHYDGIKLTLKGHVFVENVLGQVTADQAILIRDEEHHSKIDFPWIELKEHVMLRFSTGTHVQCHQITLDYLSLTSTLIGRPQIYYRDTRGEVYADSAVIEYEENQKSFQPIKVTLTGNIQLIRNPLNEEKEKALQYALADWVQFFPKEESMTLKAEEGKRVLFYDMNNELQLSARTIQAQKNGPEGKESIQGFGDVRFVFKEDELNKLKEQFHWNESSS